MSKATNRIKSLHGGRVNFLASDTCVDRLVRTRETMPMTVRFFDAEDIYVRDRSGPMREFRCGHRSQMGTSVHDRGVIIQFTKAQMAQDQACADCLY